MKQVSVDEIKLGDGLTIERARSGKRTKSDYTEERGTVLLIIFFH